MRALCLFWIFSTTALIAQQKPEPAQPAKPQPATPAQPAPIANPEQKPAAPQTDGKNNPQPGKPVATPQTPVPGKPGEKPAKPGDKKDDSKSAANAPTAPPADGDFPRRKEAFRFRILAGAGYETIHPGILSEAGPAWQLNSFIRATDGTSQPGLLIKDTGNIPARRYKVSGDVAFKDRLFLEYERQWTGEKYSNRYPTRVTFAAPGNATYETALYEGLRLLEYKEVTNNYGLTYLHPIGKGVKIGAFVEREEYHENIEISMGSLSLTRTTPDVLTWSQAGSIPGQYRADGNTFGLALRYQMFEWLSFAYRLNPIRRAGNFSMAGPQILNAQTGQNGPTSLAVLVPMAYGEFSDKGIRHRIETSFRFLCRYYAIVGVVKEDYKRNYSIYVGNTFATVGNFTPKTSGIGFGEMSQPYKASKTEIYLKFGAAFFL